MDFQMFKAVTYVVANAANPSWGELGAIRPSDERLDSVDPKYNVVTLSGTISKGGKSLDSKALRINAYKYAFRDTEGNFVTRIVANPTTGTYTVTLPEFPKGRNGVVTRHIDAEAASELNSLFEDETPKPELTPLLAAKASK